MSNFDGGDSGGSEGQEGREDDRVTRHGPVGSWCSSDECLVTIATILCLIRNENDKTGLVTWVREQHSLHVVFERRN
jgi:hypothetical protein